MKPRLREEHIEGPEAWQRFNRAMQKVITVPHAEIQRRVEEQRRLAAKNPHKRGPKPKTKPSA